MGTQKGRHFKLEKGSATFKRKKILNLTAASNLRTNKSLIEQARSWSHLV